MRKRERTWIRKCSMEITNNNTINTGGRSSNMELCKICAIILVLLVHSVFPITGRPLTTSDSNVSALFWEALSIIGVNVFVLVTGYFSTVPKNKSVINILFVCFFYAGIKVLLGLFRHDLNYESFFFVSKANWFVTAYLGMLLLSPALNSCAITTNKRSFGLLVLALLCFEVWFGFIPGWGGQNFSTGYSILSFSILYLLGRYIRLYGLPAFIVKWSGVLYLVTTVVISLMAYCLLIMGWRTDIMIPTFYEYTNPLIIFSAVCFMLFFTKLRIGQSKFINHLGKSTLAVLLIHTMEPFTTWRKDFFTGLWHNYSGFQLFLYYALSILAIFILCCLVDQIRLLFWKPILNYLNKRIKRNEIF